MKNFLVIIFSLLILSGCEFISNTFNYKNTTEEFVESLLDENYDKCISLFAMDHRIARNSNVDSMKLGLVNFRTLIINNFGNELDYTLMNSEKKISNIKEESTPRNTTRIYVQFSNKHVYGVFKVLFDDRSKKILNINMEEVKEPIPNMTFFWIFGIIAICIPIFNIYIVWRIKKSSLNRKWIKYIAVVLINIPTFTYTASGEGLVELFSIQFLFGIGFNYMGYLNAAWSIGIPIGGLYWLWKLKSDRLIFTNDLTTTVDETDRPRE
jgi:hypothetical protein